MSIQNQKSHDPPTASDHISYYIARSFFCRYDIYPSSLCIAFKMVCCWQRFLSTSLMYIMLNGVRFIATTMLPRHPNEDSSSCMKAGVYVITRGLNYPMGCIMVFNQYPLMDHMNASWLIVNHSCMIAHHSSWLFRHLVCMQPYSSRNKFKYSYHWPTFSWQHTH